MSSKIRADLHVPDEFGALMDQFAEICDGLIAACVEVAAGSGDFPDPASQFATESTLCRTTYPYVVMQQRRFARDATASMARVARGVV